MTRPDTISLRFRAGAPRRRFFRARVNTGNRKTIHAGLAAIVCTVASASALSLVGRDLPSITTRTYQVNQASISSAFVSISPSREGPAGNERGVGLKTITLNDEGHALRFETAARTVDEAVRGLGIVLTPADRIQPSLESPLAPGQQIILRRAKRIQFGLRGLESTQFTHASTVAEFLETSGVSLGPEDNLSAAAQSPVIDGMSLRISRERQEVLEILETVPFQSVRRLDPSLEPGEFRREPGKRGLLHREVRITYSMSREVSREIIREWTDPHPQDEIVYEGISPAPVPPSILQTAQATVRNQATATAIPNSRSTSSQVATPTSTPTPSVREAVAVSARSPRTGETKLPKGKRIRVYATWYNPASAGTPKGDPMYGITTTGTRVDRGIVAVDPKVIPLGTKFFVPGYGNAVAADTGFAVVGDIIDLGFPDGVTPNWTPGWIEITVLE